MTELHPSSLGRFIRSIAVLALPAEGQIAYLARIGAPQNVDELALEFDDGRLLAPQLEELGWIPAGSVQNLRLLNALLERMSGEEHAHLWTHDALIRSAEWAAVRSLALEVLLSV